MIIKIDNIVVPSMATVFVTNHCASYLHEQLVNSGCMLERDFEVCEDLSPGSVMSSMVLNELLNSEVKNVQ